MINGQKKCIAGLCKSYKPHNRNVPDNKPKHEYKACKIVKCFT